MITIYNFRHGARGVRVAWQCEEMGLTYRPVRFDYPVPADFRSRYPLAVVPFLEDEGGVAIGESVAQMLYLAQRHGPTPLLPTEPAAMAQVLQVTVASEASIGGPMNPMLATKFAAPADRKPNWTDDFCGQRVDETLDYIESLLGGREYLVGDALSLADLAVATTLNIWRGALGRTPPPGLAAHRERMQARPAYGRAVAAFS